MIYPSVTFRGKEGSLVVSSATLCFYGGNNSEEWLWSSVDRKISINKPGTRHAMLRIIVTLDDRDRVGRRGSYHDYEDDDDDDDDESDKKKPLLFVFPDRKTLEAAKRDIEYYVKQLKRQQHQQQRKPAGGRTKTTNDNNTPSSWEHLQEESREEDEEEEPLVVHSAKSGVGRRSFLLQHQQTSSSLFSTPLGLAPPPITNLREFNTMLFESTLADKEELLALLEEANTILSDNGSTIKQRRSRSPSPPHAHARTSSHYSSMRTANLTAFSSMTMGGDDHDDDPAATPEMSRSLILNSPFGDLDPQQQQQQQQAQGRNSTEMLPLYSGPGGRQRRRFASISQSGKINLKTKGGGGGGQLLVGGVGGESGNRPSIFDNDEEFHSPFGETTNTLMYLSPLGSQGFWYAIFIYVLQMAVITLTLADISNTGVPGNVLDLPPMVDRTVSCAQAISLFMALAYQSDMIQASLKLLYGYYSLQERYPGATKSKWLMSCLAQLLAGIMLLVDCFILTMQAHRVIDVMLNLTALLFMAEIDDVGFWMAKAGFISTSVQIAACNVVDVKVPKRKVKKRYRRLVYFSALIGLLCGYGVLKSRQLRGRYLQTNVYVQFAGDYNSKIPFFSGIFTSGNVRTGDHRQYRDSATNTILLSYCHSERAWTFSDLDDSCLYFAKSLKTTSYDVTTIRDSDWQVVDSFSRLQPFESFSIVKRNCLPYTNSCKGKCIDHLCVCPPERFGLDCEFRDLCPELVVNGRTSPFQSIPVETWYPDKGVKEEIYQLSSEFQILKNNATGTYVRVYDMPVYYSLRTYPANVIFFGGRRWVLTTEQDLFNLTEARIESPSRRFFPEKTVEVLENGFHGYHRATYTPLLMSDPADFHSPEFQPSPAGLRWWRVRELDKTTRQYVPDTDNILDTVLACKSCLPQHGGYCDSFGGSCNYTTGQCDCDDNFYGNLCELTEPCYAAGHGGNLCNSGACDQVSGFCRCELPFHGKLCKERYRCYEALGACENGGECNPVSGECDCSHDPSISGYLCELALDCEIYGCENGGLCGDSGACICRPPFAGVLCDLLDTSLEEFFCSNDSDCMDGICNTESGICICEDPRRYGTLCEHLYNCYWESSYWSSGLCTNGGLCNRTTGLCDCPEPYFGPDCSRVPPCTNSSDCSDRGFCDSGECQCYGNFDVSDLYGVGKTCELDPSDCYGCFGRGACEADGYSWERSKCDCYANYYGGEYCNYRVATEEADFYKDLGRDAFVEECGFPPIPPNASSFCKDPFQA